jgi:hypothetical protein
MLYDFVTLKCSVNMSPIQGDRDIDEEDAQGYTLLLQTKGRIERLCDTSQDR